MTLRELPVMSVRDTVVFPGILAPLDIGRAASLAAIDHVATLSGGNRCLVIALQLEPQTEDPGLADLYPIATLVELRKVVRQPGAGCMIIVAGLERVKLLDLDRSTPVARATVEAVQETVARSPDRTVLEAWVTQHSRYFLVDDPPDLASAADDSARVDAVASAMDPDVLESDARASLLQELDVARRFVLLRDGVAAHEARIERYQAEEAARRAAIPELGSAASEAARIARRILDECLYFDLGRMAEIAADELDRLADPVLRADLEQVHRLVTDPGSTAESSGPRRTLGILEGVLAFWHAMLERAAEDAALGALEPLVVERCSELAAFADEERARL